jgi:hypothetical protein
MDRPEILEGGTPGRRIPDGEEEWWQQGSIKEGEHTCEA